MYLLNIMISHQYTIHITKLKLNEVFHKPTSNEIKIFPLNRRVITKNFIYRVVEVVSIVNYIISYRCTCSCFNLEHLIIFLTVNLRSCSKTIIDDTVSMIVVQIIFFTFKKLIFEFFWRESQQIFHNFTTIEQNFILLFEESFVTVDGINFGFLYDA